MKKTAVINNEGDKKRINRGLIVFIAIFLCAVIIFGIVFGVIAAVRHKNAVVIYQGITMDKEGASFFASYYKTQYMNALISTGVEAADSEWFWNSEYEKGKTYGDALIDRFERDALNISGVKYIFVKIGLNDILHQFSKSMGNSVPHYSAKAIINGYKELVERAHAKGIKIFFFTKNLMNLQDLRNLIL